MTYINKMNITYFLILRNIYLHIEGKLMNTSVIKYDSLIFNILIKQMFIRSIRALISKIKNLYNRHGLDNLFWKWKE